MSLSECPFFQVLVYKSFQRNVAYGECSVNQITQFQESEAEELKKQFSRTRVYIMSIGTVRK